MRKIIKNQRSNSVVMYQQDILIINNRSDNYMYIADILNCTIHVQAGTRGDSLR